MSTIEASDWVRVEEVFVAYVYDPEYPDEIYDHVFTWETAQNYVLHEGMIAVALRDDGGMSREAAQALYDSERARYIDCWEEAR